MRVHSAEPPTGGSEYLWIKPLLLMTVAGVTLACAVGPLLRMPTVQILFTYVHVIWVFAPLAIVAAIAGVTVQALIRGEKSPSSFLWSQLSRRVGTVDLASGTIAPIVAMPLILGAFGTLKQVLPVAHPFAWDDTFAAADRLLFGVQPWRVTHSLFGPRGTMILECFYDAWIVFLFIAVIAFALASPRYRRARFFLAFGASWLLLGVGASILFSSAGPCFSALIGAQSASEYSELMARLQTLDRDGYILVALDTQRSLWRSYSDHAYGFGMGISAMPSMHNAIACLYALALWNAGSVLRCLSSAFAAIIFVASIHFGWHYAVDGLFSWLAMAGIWHAAGVYLRHSGYEAAVRHAVVAPGRSFGSRGSLPA